MPTVTVTHFKQFSFIAILISLFFQTGCTANQQPASKLDRLQGYWEDDGPRGITALTISGDTLHFYQREDFWYQATFTLTENTEPQQLLATITDSAPPAKDIGGKVVAVYKFEDGTFFLASNGGAENPPVIFQDAQNYYEFKKMPAKE